MSFYVDLDQPIPVLYLRTRGQVYELPRYIKGMRTVGNLPYSAIQLTEKNLLAELSQMIDRSKEALA